MKSVKIITIESDFGAGTKGAKLGPQAVLKRMPHELLFETEIINITADNLPDEDVTCPKALNINSVLSIQKHALEAIQNVHNEGFTPIILSGDHSNGLAAISAYKDLYPKQELGVIWIDAHADLHTPYTTPSGNMHGMPLGAALGIEKTIASKSEIDKDTQLKWKELLQLGKNRISPKITSNNLVFIDIRDLESEEINFIKEKQILHFTPADRQVLGLELIIEKSIAHLAHCHHIYVSFDVDSLDPSISSGTGTPVHGGLSEKEAVSLLNAFWSEPNVFAIEVTEINPLLDRHNPMEEVAANIIAASIR